MLIMTVWLALAFESNEPVEIKRDRRSDFTVWIVGIGWLVLLLPRFNGPQLIPRMILIRIIGWVKTGMHSLVSSCTTSSSARGLTLS